MRRAKAMTHEDVVESTGLDRTTVSRIERGLQDPSARTCRLLAHAYEVSLDTLWAAVDSDGQTATPASESIVEWLTMYAAHEQTARQLWAYEPVTFHALLQTEAYASAVERTGLAVSDREVAQRVQVRMARQGVLARRPDALDLSVLLDESVLYRHTGSDEVMAAQLRHVVGLVERPNVAVQVLPLKPGVHAAAFGAFSVLTPLGATAPRMACSHDRTGFRYHESSAAVDAHATLFNHLCALALSPSDSLDLMHTVAKEKYPR